MANQDAKNKDKRVKIGDKIVLHYTSKLDDGKIVETTRVRNTPVNLTLGDGLIHKALEVNIVGMTEGESKRVTLPPHKAYGQYRRELVFIVDKNKFENTEPKIGQEYKVRSTKGERYKVRVTDIKEDKVTLDANHTLAGKEISYELELLQIIS